MSRKDFRKKSEEELKDSQSIQNEPPERQWSSLEHFWHSSVKNGTPLIFESFRSHLRAMGWLDDQSRWRDGARHFGIPLEK